MDIRKGLIMEGGAMRGMFTCGVIDVMMDNGIEFDGAVGVSAGAAFGINYKSRQIGRALRYNKKYMRDIRYCSVWNLIKSGNMFDAKFCYDTVPFELDPFDVDEVKRNPMEFYITATDVDTGEPRYYKFQEGNEKDLLWLRASASIPIISKPVEVDGYRLLDGGMADSIPVKFLEDQGYNRNVAILTRPIDYVRPEGEFTGIAKVLLKKYPNMINTMENRAAMYNGETKYIAEQEEKGNLFVIRPPKSLHIPNMEKNPEVLQHAYDVGREVMYSKMDELKKYLSPSTI